MKQDSDHRIIPKDVLECFFQQMNIYFNQDDWIRPVMYHCKVLGDYLGQLMKVYKTVIDYMPERIAKFANDEFFEMQKNFNHG